MIFTYKYGRPGLAIGAVIVLVFYVALNIVFFVLFTRKIKQKDEKF